MHYRACKRYAKAVAIIVDDGATAFLLSAASLKVLPSIMFA